MAKDGGYELCQKKVLYVLNLSADFYFLLNDLGPLNSKKQFRAA